MPTLEQWAECLTSSGTGGSIGGTGGSIGGTGGSIGGTGGSIGGTGGSIGGTGGSIGGTGGSIGGGIVGLANNAILTEQMVPRKEIAAWIFRMYLAAPEPEYGVCKKCGARVQDGATKSHSSAAGTLLPGHTEPSVPEEKNPVIALREQSRDEMSIDDIEERAIERQQRLASVPEEIKNLHLPAGQQCPREQVNERIDEAYRRGKESK